jgi:hypothetical protein
MNSAAFLRVLAIFTMLWSCSPPQRVAGNVDRLRTRDGLCASVRLPGYAFGPGNNVEACLRSGFIRTLYDDPNRHVLIVRTRNASTLEWAKVENLQVTILKDGLEVAKFMMPEGSIPDAQINRSGTTWSAVSVWPAPFKWVDGVWIFRFVTDIDTDIRGEVTIAIGSDAARVAGLTGVELARSATPTVSKGTTESVPCSQHPDCSVLGHCTSSGSRCIAGSDSDCKKSELCRDDRKCTALAGECVR